MKIFCIGSATLDIFFIFKNLNFFKNKISEKNNVPEIFVDIGGGALNSAFNLKNLNLETEAIVKLGNDFVGRMIKNKIEEKNIPAKIVKTKGDSTLSIIFLNKNTGEKYIFTYRGDEIFKTQDIPLSTDSAYLISTGITPIAVWESVIKKIKNKKNFLGILPSKNLLFKRTSVEILNKCDFVVLNDEEAKILLKIKKEIQKEEILKKFNELLKNVSFKVITFGKKGAVLIYKNKIFSINPFKKTKIIDTTGAGDCFASTLFGLIIKSINEIDEKNLIIALKLSVVNTAYNLRKIGAQTGILKEKELMNFKNANIKVKIYKI